MLRAALTSRGKLAESSRARRRAARARAVRSLTRPTARRSRHDRPQRPRGSSRPTRAHTRARTQVRKASPVAERTRSTCCGERARGGAECKETSHGADEEGTTRSGDLPWVEGATSSTLCICMCTNGRTAVGYSSTAVWRAEASLLGCSAACSAARAPFWPGLRMWEVRRRVLRAHSVHRRASASACALCHGASRGCSRYGFSATYGCTYYYT